MQLHNFQWHPFTFTFAFDIMIIFVYELLTASSPKGLTVDSGTRHMFYTDDGADSIVKVQMHTLVTATIIDTGLHKPRGIVADTRYRYLVYRL